MNLFNRATKHVKENIAEYYTLFIVIVAVPVSLGLIFGFKWGLLASVAAQAIIGVLYIRGSGE